MMNAKYKDGSAAKAGDIVQTTDENGLPYMAAVVGEKEIENLPESFDLVVIPLPAPTKLVRASGCQPTAI